jgi:hypothetical protein
VDDKENDNVECTCGSEAPVDIKYRALDFDGQVVINGREIYGISTKWSLGDYLGAIMVRLDMNRMNYAVKPGLYAVGRPGPDSNVIVSANYKLSFDVLRRELKGLNVWVLVIDTKGVNVWCAAGKGTFGTKEIVRMIIEEKLPDIVSHRNIIVPQLGAPGVAAGLVQIMSEFNVIYGPVRAKDLPGFIKNGMKAGAEMRRVRFGLADRLTVALLDFATAAKIALILSIIFVFSALLFPTFGHTTRILIIALWAAVISGSLLMPAALPYLPGRAFSVKGGVAGIIISLVPIILFKLSPLQTISVAFAMSAVSAFIAVNFTGASTFTSLSGVRKELKYAIPSIIGLLIVAGALAVL